MLQEAMKLLKIPNAFRPTKNLFMSVNHDKCVIAVI